MNFNGIEINCFEQLPILEAIPLDGLKTIAAVGAGGKTTLLFTLAQALYEQGKKVVITTSTHFHVPEQFSVQQILPTLDDITEAAKRGLPVACGEPVDKIRLAAPGADAMQALYEHFDVVLIEADGSKGYPIKAPGEHEPVIPPKTDLVCIVAGLSAVGKEISEASYRPELVAELLETHERHVLHTHDVANLMFSEKGGQKNIPEGMRRIFLLNQADGFWGTQRAYKATAMLFYLGAEHVVVTDLINSNRAKLVFMPKYTQ